MDIVGTGTAEQPLEDLQFSEMLQGVLPSAVVAVDARQRVTTFTPEAEALTRLRADSVLRQPLTRLPAPLQDAIRETFASGKAIRDRPISLPGTAAKPWMGRVSTSPVQNGGDHIHGVVAILSDLTCARRLAEKMRQLDRLASIGTLSASMAHEIKNALVPVRTFVDLLLQKNKDAELAELVIREMRRVESIVSQMLKFAGPARPTFAPISIHDVLDQALQLVRHQLEGKKVCLATDYQASPETVQGDTYQLEQAFLNLFFNALDAMGPNGTLTVATRVLPPEVLLLGETSAAGNGLLEVTVADTGTGVADTHVDRLFEPFFTTKPDGTGLGLTISRRIVHEHQGRVSVDTRVNQGTTFTILLPLLADPFAPRGTAY